MQRLTPEYITPRLPFLNPDQFAVLCNDLLSSSARAAGIPVSHLSLNLRLRDPDGGLDARCDNAPRAVGRIIPAVTCGYQYKSGSTKKSAKAVALDDIVEKPRVLELLKAKRPFIYLAATDYGDEFEKDVIEEVKAARIEVVPGLIIVISGHSLAHQLLTHPALVARFTGLDVELESFEGWSTRESMRNPFSGDAATDSRLAEMRRIVSQDAGRLRVVGSPGDGKTRTVLEALRGTDLEPDVLYAEQSEHVTPAFVGFLRTTSDVQCTLVIDEVDDSTAPELLDRFSSLPAGVRLVLIGIDASARSQPNTLKIEGLSQELLVGAIEAIVPGIPRATSEDIARVCENSPKLAVLIAKRIVVEPGLASHHERMADHEIQGVLDNYLPLAKSDWKVLSGVALLERLGWTRETEEESAIVFEFLGLDLIEARQVVEDLHRRYGIAPLAGRFRYVSPQILADHLATRQLGAWTARHFKEFIPKLTPPMVESFARRLRGLSTVLANRETVEEVILGYQGPFQSLADLEREHFSILLRQLAGPFRRGTLDALRRMIEPASIEELREATDSRRDVVWAIEELLWPEDTFEQAGKLLLRLAIAENESITNNATGIFVETFQTFLGRTAAGLAPRLSVLRTASRDSDAAARVLASKALGRALTVANLHRMGMPPTDVPGMPAKEWRPETWGEVWGSMGEYITILKTLLGDPDISVKQEAAEAMAQSLEAAILYPRVFDTWQDAANLLVGQDYEVRRPLLQKLEWRLERAARDEAAQEAAEEASEEQKTEIREAVSKRLDALQETFDRLKGDDFSSQFRWALSRDPWRTLRGPSPGYAEETQHELDRLIAEVLATPELLDSEWEWLLSVPGNVPEIWVERLGTADSQGRVRSSLLALSRRAERAIGWVSLYHLAHARSMGAQEDLDRQIENVAQEGAGALQVFDLVVKAGYSPSRLERLIGLFSSGAVGGHLIRTITFSPWRESLAPEEVGRLIEAVLGSPESQDAAVSFLSFYLHFAPDSGSALSHTALKALELTAEHASSRAGTLDEWAEVAKNIVKFAPNEVAAAVVRRLETTEGFHLDDLTDVLEEAWRVGDTARLFYDLLAPRIEQRDVDGWKLRAQLERFPLSELGSEQVISWVREKPDVRAYAIAQVLGAPAGRPTDLHAALLEHFSGQGVADAFVSDFVSGTYWGPAADRTRGLIAQARQWLDDDRPAVRDWAGKLIQVLEAMLEGDETRDAEERFR
jgi:hypothetical protein